jgi:hypothetical protein
MVTMDSEHRMARRGLTGAAVMAAAMGSKIVVAMELTAAMIAWICVP